MATADDVPYLDAAASVSIGDVDLIGSRCADTVQCHALGSAVASDRDPVRRRFRVDIPNGYLGHMSAGRDPHVVGRRRRSAAGIIDGYGVDALWRTATSRIVYEDAHCARSAYHAFCVLHNQATVTAVTRCHRWNTGTFVQPSTSAVGDVAARGAPSWLSRSRGAGGRCILVIVAIGGRRRNHQIVGAVSTGRGPCRNQFADYQQTAAAVAPVDHRGVVDTGVFLKRFILIGD